MLEIIGAVVTFSLLFCAAILLTQLVLLRVLKVPIEKIKVGFGPRIRSFYFRDIEVIIGCLPTGSWIQYDVPLFRERPLPWRLIMVVLQPLVILSIGLSILGFLPGLTEFVSGFREFIEGAFRPRAVAINLLGRFHTILQQSPIQACGVYAVKFAAISIFPGGAMMLSQFLFEFRPPIPPMESDPFGNADGPEGTGRADEPAPTERVAPEHPEAEAATDKWIAGASCVSGILTLVTAAMVCSWVFALVMYGRGL